MIIEMVRDTLLWCAVINYGLLLYWYLIFIFAHDWMYGFHGRWFNLSEEKFDSIHYSGMAIYKLTIMFFNLVPYIVLKFIVQ